MKPVIILRPEPGASETASRARKLGLVPRLCPLFEARPIQWNAPPPEHFDALLMTSAQAPRLGGPQLSIYRTLPAYAVGRATAQAMVEQDFNDISSGDGDGSAIAARIAGDGHRHVLHLGGTTLARFESGTLKIERVPVYTVRTRPDPQLDAQFQPGAIMLVHSPRAGSRLAELVAPEQRSDFHVIAISPAALSACGLGWASGEAPDRPDDERMLALAVRLCE